MHVPFLALSYRKPVEGLPPLQAWINTALDLFHLGYETWREPLECRLKPGQEPGKPLGFCSLQVTKGLGRLSIMYFGLLWTFFKKNELTMEETQDFKRCLV